MNATRHAPQPYDAIRLNLFCSRVDEMWRVHIRPGWRPPFLQQFFDSDGEASPALLDFEDMHRYLAAHGASVKQRTSRLGGVELTARGRAAGVLAKWLATAFASGVRLPANEHHRATGG